MTTKHLSGYYADGYTLSAGYSKLVIDKTADVGGRGIAVPFSAIVVNHGAVYGSSQGVYLEAGGLLINGSAKDTSATITAGDYSKDSASGVIANIANEAAAVANFGTIYATGTYGGAGVYLSVRGSLTNGSAKDTTALIDGYSGEKGAAAVVNFGTIIGHGGFYYKAVGVALGGDGSLTNGSAEDTAARIVGPTGVSASAPATIANFGTIDGGTGVSLEAGGSVTNGSISDTTALIYGNHLGVSAGGAAIIANFGTIAGDGVSLGAGGSVTNGSANDATALLSGFYGAITSGAAATIANFGTILTRDESSTAVALSAGGSVTNGSASDTTALINGYGGGVKVSGAAATIINFGAIFGGFYYTADFGPVVSLGAGGSLTNGSVDDTTALISGPGVVAYGAAATIANFGSITGKDIHHFDGVDLSAGGLVTNGSADDFTAFISGRSGVRASGGATIVNYGAIKGYQGVSVYLSGADSEVIAEAGSRFLGTIEGGYGTLALAGGGAGTISSLGHGGTLTGAVRADFIHFDQVVIDAGGAWTLAGTNKVDQTASLVDQGTLINSGALTVSGTLTVAASAVFSLAGGDISGAPTGAARIVDDGLVIKNVGAGTIAVGASMIDDGVVEVASGTLDFTSRLFGTGVMKIDAGATLEADAGAASTLTASFDGAAAILALKRPNALDATLSGFAAGDVIDLLAIKATGASVNGSDQLVVVDGARTVASLQLSGNYAGGTFSTASDGHGGTSVTLTSVGPDLPSVAGMASAMAALGAPAAVAALGYDLRAERTPMLARPNVHIQ